MDEVPYRSLADHGQVSCAGMATRSREQMLRKQPFAPATRAQRILTTVERFRPVGRTRLRLCRLGFLELDLQLVEAPPIDSRHFFFRATVQQLFSVLAPQIAWSLPPPAPYCLCLGLAPLRQRRVVARLSQCGIIKPHRADVGSKASLERLRLMYSRGGPMRIS